MEDTIKPNALSRMVAMTLSLLIIYICTKHEERERERETKLKRGSPDLEDIPLVPGQVNLLGNIFQNLFQGEQFLVVKFSDS